MSVFEREVPRFGRKFEGLMSYLHDMEDSPVSISPQRYIKVMNVDIQTLAAKAHVHRNTVTRAPETETVQHYLRQTLRVIHAAADIAGDVETAIYWFKNSSLAPFDYKTPQDLVSEGRTDDLIRYVQSLSAGFAG